MKKLLEKGSTNCLFFKFDLKMKLTSLLFLVAVFSIQANTYSQKTKLSLDLENVSINDVISEIESKTEFRFIYKVIEVNTQRKVSVHVNKEYINRVLDILFNNSNIDYRVKDRQVILKKKTPQLQGNSDTYKEQQIKVSGVINDENGIPISGVNIIIKGTNTGVASDFDGGYSLPVPSKNSILQFSFVGYITQEITVGSQTEINVVLKEDSLALDEVVVQAYRNTTDEKNAAAIASIKAETIENRPNASVINTLQAQVPGLVIGSGTGQPGANSAMIIRGIGSITGDIEPLIVVDGTPVDKDDFRGINPNDIETVSVLKDAAASAAYGNRGANGVLIISTKKGTYNSGLEISYSESYGRSYQQKNNYGLMNSFDLLTLQKKLGIGTGSNLTDAEISTLANQNNTDWTDFILQKGVVQSRQLSLSSGSKNLKNFTSFGYTNQEGIIKKTGLERFTLRSNFNGKSKDEKFNYGLSLTGAFAESDFTTDIGSGLVFFNPMVGAIWGQPYLNPYRPDGTVNDDSFDEFQPLSASPYVILNNFRYNPNTNKQIKSVINLNASYEIIEGLKLNGSIGIDYQQNETLRIIHPESTNRLFYPNHSDAEIQGRQIEDYSRLFSINMNASLNYKKSFGKHTIDATLFTETFESSIKSFGYVQLGLNPKTFYPGDGDSFVSGDTRVSGEFVYIPSVRSNKNKGGLFSYFTIVDYDFDDRFGFAGTLRRDASYKFASSNRWGTFYSVSGRWNLDKESFMESVDFIDLLKLRASYGVTGNQNINGSFLSGGSLSRTLYETGTGYNNSNSIYRGTLGTDTLKWETVYQTNIGLDFGLFNSRLNGTVDVYDKTTKELFTEGRISGVNGQYAINLNDGSLQNRGLELSLNYRLIDNDNFKINVFGNASYNKNKVLKLAQGDIDNTDTVISEGHPINSYYLVPYVGVNPANGNALYRTKEGGITEEFSLDDRVIMDAQIPIYQGGFGTSIDYKGFFLTSNFSFVADVHRYNDQARFFANNPQQALNFNVSQRFNRAWTPENTITDQEGLFSLQANYLTDKFLHDASYLRLRFLSLGYNFGDKILKATKFLKAGKVYVQGENLLTWTKWEGLDVEADLRSFDFGNYPTPRIFTAGIEVKF